MLSKNQIKRIQSLARKKGRREEGCFIAEGNKLVEDTLSAFECDLILATSSWIVSHAHESLPKIQEVDEQEMSKVSQLVTPPDVLAVYRIPEYHLNIETLKKELVLALDTVQDPAIWELSFAWPIGSVFAISFVPPIPPIFITLRLCKPLWGHWLG